MNDRDRKHRSTDDPHSKRDHWPEVVPLHPVGEAASSGDRRQLLVAIRDRLQHAVFEDDRTQPRDLSALCGRLLEVSKEILALDLAELAEAEHDRTTEDETFDPVEL